MIRELLSRLRVGIKCAAILALAGLGAQSWALGLGELELNSALNEKLDASIEIYDAAGLQPTEIIVSMASAEDFARVGVERFFFLTDIRFEVTYDRNGVGRVNLTSSQPITEPYLNFLVEALWPNGRMLKEYTLLLDPPTFGQAAAPRVATPSRAAETAPAGRVTREAPATTGTRVQMAERSAPTEPSPLDEGVVDGEYRMTDRQDTLWSIANRTRPSSEVSVNQNMLAIQRLNPDAFLHDNINLLKAGYTLRLPTEAEALAFGESEATQTVARQDEAWRALSRGERVAEEAPAPRPAAQAADASSSELRGQLDATGDGGGTAAAATSADGELRIVAGDGDSVSGVPAVGADAKQLASALEEQDRLGREVEELTYELDREKELAANQLEVKERQLEVKDQQIAEMQAELARIREELQQIQQSQSQNQSAPRSADAGAEDPWWQSGYVMAGAAGFLVLLLVYGLVAARRKRALDDRFEPIDSLAEDASEEAAKTATAVAVAPLVSEETAEAKDVEPLSTQASPEQAADDVEASETGDVIGEADIYIAYGRYPQAISLLLGVLADNPGRNDVRVKLLELYAETRDRAAFDTHRAELIEHCEDEATLQAASELAQQFGVADEAPASGEALLDEALVDEEASVQEVAQLTDVEPPITVADLALDSADVAAEELDLLGSETEVAADSNGESEANGFHDFELEFDASEDGSEAAGDDLERDADATLADATADASDQLGGDLGIDFKLDDDELGGSAEDALDALENEAATEDAFTSFDDVELDLDLDLASDNADEEDDFDFGDDTDEATTKLDLARAYIDMGDEDGARDILNEVLAEGNPEQRQRAQSLLEDL